MLTLLALSTLAVASPPRAPQGVGPQSARVDFAGEIVWTNPTMSSNLFTVGDLAYGSIGVDLSVAPTQIGSSSLGYVTSLDTNQAILGSRWVLETLGPSTLTRLVIEDGVAGSPDTMTFEQSLRGYSQLPPGGARVVLSVTDTDGDGWSSPEVGLLPSRIESSAAAGLTATLMVLDVLDNVLAQADLAWLEIDVTGEAGCGGYANTTGLPGRLTGVGSRAVADNSFSIVADRLPSQTFGMFIVSSSDGFYINPGGFTGFLCLGSGVGRFMGPGEVQNSGMSGTMTLSFDLTSMPTVHGFESIAAGETRYFQLWHRDFPHGPAAGSGTGTGSNFTSSLAVTFE